MLDLITIGEVLIDLTQTEIDEQHIRHYAANPGGAPANVAVAAAKLGAKTGFIGKLGRDTPGCDLLAVLDRNGVWTDAVALTDESPTTHALVSVAETGERSFSFFRSPGADALLTEEEALAGLKELPKVLHFGSVSLTTEPARSATLAAADHARKGGALVSYDPNYRDSLWPDQRTAVRWMKAPLDRVDILKISDEELPLLSGRKTPEAGTKLLAKHGISLILVTLGSQGVFYRLGEHTGVVPGVKVKVADTNGAGDTFFGAFLCGLTRRGDKPLEGLEPAELEQLLRYANGAAALTCSRSGAIPAMPTAEELRAFLDRLSREAGKPHTMEERLADCYDELKWLYHELYHGDDTAFDYFIAMLRRSYAERKQSLRELDERRAADPDWYRSNKLMGMMLYVDNFAGTLNGVREKLDYLQECGVNYVHLMPLLRTVKERSDGGYAVADFREVQPELGTMADLEALADESHARGVSLALDFVMNHTSEDHAWAKAARAGDPDARARYFFYDNWDIPNAYERTVPQVFPTTAPGNFTWLEDCRQIVMTSFYPYQWDLNYHNPMVFNDMTDNLLYLANRGMDVIRLDAVPYIWKELGTDCRNLPQVHTLTRMLHLACQVVCPSVLLLGEVVMEPRKVAPYFGTPEKPECQMLYNVTTMCSTWHTLATRDVRLLRRQMEQVCALPKNALFQNYLRCHDDIGWGLDYPWLSWFGVEEVAHKRYLNDWFTGRFPGSWSRGELYNDDPRLGDARLCGTTASLCGVEAAKSGWELTRAMDCDLMLHAWMLTQSGIPVLYSGDEIGQLNDYSYHDDPDKQVDSRYLHRGRFRWEDAAKRNDTETVQGRVFQQLRRLERCRAENEVFRADADVAPFDTGTDRVLGIRRSYGGKTLIALFNFSEEPQFATYPVGKQSLFSQGAEIRSETVRLSAYGFAWIETE